MDVALLLLGGTVSVVKGFSVLELSETDTAVEVLEIVELISCSVVPISGDVVEPSVI